MSTNKACACNVENQHHVCIDVPFTIRKKRGIFQRTHPNAPVMPYETKKESRTMSIITSTRHIRTLLRKLEGRKEKRVRYGRTKSHPS